MDASINCSGGDKRRAQPARAEALPTQVDCHQVSLLNMVLEVEADGARRQGLGTGMTGRRSG